jgi:PAS domain S-box-containing protein
MGKDEPRFSDLALNECLQEVVGYIHTKLGMYTSCLFFLDDATQELVLYSAAGDEKLIQHINKLRIRKGEGLTGSALEEDRSVVCQDVSKDTRFIRGPLTLTRSEFCAPIKVGDRIVGVLDVQDSKKNSFRKELVAELEELAQSVSSMVGQKEDTRSVGNGQRRKLKERLAQVKLSEERYRLLVDNIQDPIIIIDFDGRVLWANRCTPDYIGLAETELPGAHVSRFLKKGNMFRLFQLFNEMKEGRVVKDLKLDISTSTGYKVAEATCTPIPDGGQITSCEIILRDITERATLERLRKNYLKTLEEEVQRRTEEIKDLQRASILAIATLAESIDNFTCGHLERMRQYARVIADELKSWPRYSDLVTEEYVELVYDLSPLHDIGKVGIRDSILMKEDKLTADEFAKMKEHTEIGANALRMAGQLIHRESLFAMAEMIARFHHQWWDGSGYPAVRIGEEVRPLRGDEIPLCARIVALADVYDALTSKRPYKEPYPHEVAKQMILKDSGRHFDPDCVQAFTNREADFLLIKQKWTDTDPTQTNGEAGPLQLSNRDLLTQPAAKEE